MTTQAGLQSDTGGQPAVATPSPSTSSTSSSATSTDSTPSTDPWADAESAYNADLGSNPFADLPNAILSSEGSEKGTAGPNGKTEQPAEKAADSEAKADSNKEPTDETAPPDSDNENFWSTEGLDTPDKVAQRLKKIQGFMTKKTQESKAEAEKIKEANGTLAGLIAQVAADPDKLAPILQQYGKDLEASGIQVNWNAINAAIGGKPPKEVDDSTTKPKDDLTEQRSTYVEGAAKYLLESKDDADFARRQAELQWHSHQQLMQHFQTGFEKLKEFTQQTAKSEVEPLIKEKQSFQKVNMWSSAITELGADTSMEGFAAATKNGDDGMSELDRYIEADPMLKTMVVAINTNPDAAAKMGITPKKLLARAYNDYNTPQRIKAAEERARRELQSKIEGAGEIPGSHTQTVKTGGMDWDEIEKEDGDPFSELYKR